LADVNYTILKNRSGYEKITAVNLDFLLSSGAWFKPAVTN